METSFLIHLINSKEPLQTVNRVQTVWLDLKITHFILNCRIIYNLRRVGYFGLKFPFGYFKCNILIYR